jgi:drug/metabolite transporter (DMT)-like permease
LEARKENSSPPA